MVKTITRVLVATIDNAEKLKQAKFIFFVNFLITISAVSIFIQSLEGKVAWKIICSGLGSALLLALTILLLIRIFRLRRNQ